MAMKPKLTFASVFFGAVTIIWIAGCAVRNPQYTPIPPGQPQTNLVPQYIPDPRINSYSNTVSGVATGLAPVNPYAGITNWAISGIFGAIGVISTLVARNKSGALNSMASAVVQSGSHPAVLDAAGNTPHFAAIADALNNQVGANQVLGTSPPPKT